MWGEGAEEGALLTLPAGNRPAGTGAEGALRGVGANQEVAGGALLAWLKAGVQKAGVQAQAASVEAPVVAPAGGRGEERAGGRELGGESGRERVGGRP